MVCPRQSHMSPLSLAVAILFGLGHQLQDRGSDTLGSLLNSSALSRGEKEGSVTLTFYPTSQASPTIHEQIIRVKRAFHESKSQFFIGLSSTNVHQLAFRRVSHDELADTLRRYGLEINFSDRYSLLQNKTASFGYRTPLQLLEYIESFVGNTELISLINERVSIL